MQVARRSASLSGQVSFGGVGLARTCGDRYCVDGLQSIDTKSAIAFQPQTFVAAKLTADERERLGDGAGSWLERGVRPLFVGPDAISYVTATAWFTEGAASSNADLACSTHRRGEAKATTLEGLPHQTLASSTEMERVHLVPSD